ncbi:MAG: alpha,alpha-trehalase TreF [Bernardetiaceae bacterium]|jgi:alpha,alpha-trehalase|nr:alpha,alpha-trehalase TreF [Bernardetiaceae bacterium]
MKITHFLIGLGLMAGSLTGCGPANPPSETATSPVAAPRWVSPEDDYGPLFAAVQTGGIFPDSKTFVDCAPRQPLPQILSAYESQRAQPGFDLKKFVDEHFAVPTSRSSTYQSRAGNPPEQHLNALWAVLTRPPDSVGGATSLIPLPKSYVVPGGRFREVYYWDSYFTMLGLQAANRPELIRSMVDNFAYLIDTLGFIPNGNRAYYLSRSQPPFFASMVELLAQTSGDSAYTRYLPALQKEYDFWMNGAEGLSPGQAAKHVVRLPSGALLNRYYDARTTPRPEAYKEDLATVAEARRAANGPFDSAAVYRHLRSGAESGWDYSSRWLADGQRLATIHTTDILPVDLNCLLLQLETTLAKAYQAAGQTQASQAKQAAAEARQQAIDQVFWQPGPGFYFDYDWVAAKPTAVYSLAGAYPLYFGAASSAQAQAVAKQLETKFLQPGGLATTLNNTGQQWDAPNGWAPLQWLAIAGLRRYNLHPLAAEIRKRWVTNNVRVYQNTGKMVEKYNVYDLTLLAGGGEYDLQDGFGWTNGVLLRLLTEKQPIMPERK